MKLRSLMVVTVLLHVSAVRAEDPKWKRYDFKDGKFSALLPAEPTRAATPLDIKGIKLTLNQYLAMNGGTVVMVCYADFPGGTPKGPPPDGFFDGVRNGMATTAKLQVVSEKKVTLGKAGYSGREVMAKVKEGQAYLRTRYYLAGPRFYQLVMVGTDKSVRGSEAGRFFDSFQLKD